MLQEEIYGKKDNSKIISSHRALRTGLVIGTDMKAWYTDGDYFLGSGYGIYNWNIWGIGINDGSISAALWIVWDTMDLKFYK